MPQLECDGETDALIMRNRFFFFGEKVYVEFAVVNYFIIGKEKLIIKKNQAVILTVLVAEYTK